MKKEKNYIPLLMVISVIIAGMFLGKARQWYHYSGNDHVSVSTVEEKMSPAEFESVTGKEAQPEKDYFYKYQLRTVRSAGTFPFIEETRTIIDNEGEKGIVSKDCKC